MLRTLIAAAFLTAFAGPALAADAAATTPSADAAKPGFSIATTELGTLLDNPVTKAVLDKDLPGLSTNPQITLARGITLKALQQFAPDHLTDERLAQVEADLAKVPADPK